MTHSIDYKISVIEYYLNNKHVGMDDVCDIFQCSNF